MSDLAKLLLRLSFGLSFALAHGLPKLMSFAEKSPDFADPFSIGPVLSMALVVFGEFFCGILVAFGALTRFAAIPPAIIMATAFFKIHAGQPWENKEAAALYGIAFICIGLLGAGKFSFDYLVFKKR
ncbi:MAG: DoxX family protein [Myxococcaceae bacterium]